MEKREELKKYITNRIWCRLVNMRRWVGCCRRRVSCPAGAAQML